MRVGSLRVSLCYFHMFVSNTLCAGNMPQYTMIVSVSKRDFIIDDVEFFFISSFFLPWPNVFENRNEQINWFRVKTRWPIHLVLLQFHVNKTPCSSGCVLTQFLSAFILSMTFFVLDERVDALLSECQLRLQW